jgi:predicted kinase
MLIAMAGLPGSGKSAVAEDLARRLGCAVVSVDRIESTMLGAGVGGDQPTGLAAYVVAEAVTDGVLAIGQSVVVDAVNAVVPARKQWMDLAAKHGALLQFVEVVCSDPLLHRSRLESRKRDLGRLPEPTWNDVEQRVGEYEPWTGEFARVRRITVDSVRPLTTIVDDVLSFVAELS